MEPEKRKNNGNGEQDLPDSKKARLAIIPADNRQIMAVKTGQRTSGLLAPNMQLEGHGSAVYSLKFDPSGQHLASASMDRNIFLWDVYGECRNYDVLKGHKNAVLEVHWTVDGSQVISASADKTVGVWDAKTGERVRKLVGHNAVVNSCAPAGRGLSLVVSGSNDGTVKLWDTRVKKCQDTFEGKYQVTAVSFSYDGESVFAGGLDNDIKVWDLRKAEISMVLQGHTDTITSVSTSPDGSFLLSNGMDNTIRCWDVRPYVPGNRCVKVFQGSIHNAECNLIKCNWSPDGSKVCAGSADKMVNVWDFNSRKLLYRLPGHKGSVNEVVFHPKEPIIGSCSTDKTIFLGELVAP